MELGSPLAGKVGAIWRVFEGDGLLLVGKVALFGALFEVEDPTWTRGSTKFWRVKYFVLILKI